MLFFTYVGKSWFEKAYHYGRNEIVVDECIPWFKTFGECINDINTENLDIVFILQLEANTYNLLSKSLKSLENKKEEMFFKVNGRWEIKSIPRTPAGATTRP